MEMRQDTDISIHTYTNGNINRIPAQAQSAQLQDFLPLRTARNMALYMVLYKALDTAQSLDPRTRSG